MFYLYMLVGRQVLSNQTAGMNIVYVTKFAIAQLCITAIVGTGTFKIIHTEDL